MSLCLAFQNAAITSIEVFKANYQSLSQTEKIFEEWYKKNITILNSVQELNLVNGNFFSIPLQLIKFPCLKRLYLNPAQFASFESQAFYKNLPSLQVFKVSAIPVISIKE